MQFRVIELSVLSTSILAKYLNQASNVPACFLVDRSLARERCSPHDGPSRGTRGPRGKASISESGRTDQMTYHFSRLNQISSDYCRAAYVGAAHSGGKSQGTEDGLALCTQIRGLFQMQNLDGVKATAARPTMPSQARLRCPCGDGVNASSRLK